jgi:hypothetical protein
VIVERDNYGPYHVRGTADDGQDGWGIQVWLKGSDQDGPEDHKFRVLNGTVIDQDIELTEKEAVMALIEQWEDRLPLMVASPI